MKVDNYTVAVVQNVEVDDATRIDVEATPRFYLREPAPNPASNGVTFRLGAPDGTDATLDVFDVRGRRVKGWRGDGSTHITVYWDMRDAHGSAIASGVYWVRLRVGDAQTVRNFVCVR